MSANKSGCWNKFHVKRAASASRAVCKLHDDRRRPARPLSAHAVFFTPPPAFGRHKRERDQGDRPKRFVTESLKPARFWRVTAAVCNLGAEQKRERRRANEQHAYEGGGGEARRRKVAKHEACRTRRRVVRRLSRARLPSRPPHTNPIIICSGTESRSQSGLRPSAFSLRSARIASWCRSHLPCRRRCAWRQASRQR